MTSTTTGLDLESMLDGQTEQTSDDDDDMSTTIDTTDAHAIRRQLESLESMYTEVICYELALVIVINNCF